MKFLKNIHNFWNILRVEFMMKIKTFIILFIFIQYSNSAIILNAAGFAVVWFISRGYCLVDNLTIN